MVKTEQLDIFFEGLKSGLNILDSSVLGGFSRDLYYKRIGSDPEFKTRVDKAIITFKHEQIQTIRKASSGSWQASAWLLERKFKDEFSLPTATERGLVERLEKIEARLNGDKLNGASTNRKDLDAAAIN